MAYTLTKYAVEMMEKPILLFLKTANGSSFKGKILKVYRYWFLFELDEPRFFFSKNRPNHLKYFKVRSKALTGIAYIPISNIDYIVQLSAPAIVKKSISTVLAGHADIMNKPVVLFLNKPADALKGKILKVHRDSILFKLNKPLKSSSKNLIIPVSNIVYAVDV